MKPKFIWSNEDAMFILGALVTLLQINFDYTNPLFSLGIGMGLKGLMSMFSVTLGNDASEDVMLIIGAFVTLAGIHFDYKNPAFFLTVGAILKAGFGIFGVAVPAVPPRTPMFFLALMLLASQACAWELPGETFHLDRQKLSINQPAAGGELDGVLMPTGNVGLGVSNNVPSYGFSIAEDFVIGNVTADGANNVKMSPIVGIGGALYLDAAPWLTSNLQNPVLLSGGFNILGPDLDGTVPGFQQTWNFVTGERKTLVTYNLPFDSISFISATIVKVFGL